MFLPRVQSAVYRRLLKPVLFRMDPETVHDRFTATGEWLGSHRWSRALTRSAFAYRDPILEQELRGVRFPNPVGLAAGFDKNAHLVGVLPSVGFGFLEIGSVTGEPCAGNPKPRLWRLPKTGGLVVYYGLKNDGAEAVVERLKGKTFGVPVGVSVAKTNSPETVDPERGIADYEKAFRLAAPVASYLTVNISCPNAFGGEPFSTPERLERLLARLDVVETSAPVFLKVAVDQTEAELDALLDVADRHRVHGLILSNLTKQRVAERMDLSEFTPQMKGGVSGRPCASLSNRLLSHAYRRAPGRYVLVGCGGIFSAEDAYEKIRLGANLVQLITGMVFQGPQLIGEINRGLVRLLRRDGFTHISQAVGSAHRA